MPPTPGAPPRKRPISIWAVANNTECIPCADARYHGGHDWPPTNSASPRGTQEDGAVGWDWGIPFGSFAGLIQNITTGTPPDFVCGAGMFGSCPPPGDNEVTELGIDAHGDSGVVDIDCHSQINQGVIPASAYYDVLNVATIHGKYAPQMKELDRLLVKDHGVLFFAGCRTGAGVSGSEFLMEVSKMLPGRDIIAMTTITITIPGRVKWSMSGGGVCCQPGTRDTSFIVPQDDSVPGQDWFDLTKYPWASNASPHAKVARDGAIIGGGGRND